MYVHNKLVFGEKMTKKTNLKIWQNHVLFKLRFSILVSTSAPFIHDSCVPKTQPNQAGHDLLWLLIISGLLSRAKLLTTEIYESS